MNVRYLFASDTPVFGGHERVCIDIARVLSSYGNVGLLLPSKNHEFIQFAKEVGFFSNIYLAEDYHRRGNVYLGRYRFGAKRRLLNMVQSIDPSFIFLMQGRIETCAPYVFALHENSQKFASILPFAHRIEDVKIGGGLRSFENIVRIPIYRRPNAFLVPSESARKQLLDRGVENPIFVVPNAVEQSSSRTNDSSNLIRCVGRIEFVQKRQNILCHTIAKNKELFRRYRFEFVGDGPDLTALQRLISTLGIADIVSCTGTLPRSSVLEGVKAIVMPSRFEGVPLIMLEALMAEIPVLGSDIDIFREYLPAECIVDFRSPDEFSSALVSLDRPEAQSVRKASAARVRMNHSTESMQSALGRIVPTIEKVLGR